MIEISEVGSPLGEVKIATHNGALCALAFADSWERTAVVLDRRFPSSPRRTVRIDGLGVGAALDSYFDGDLDALAAVPIDIAGTPFQEKVWEQLAAVRPGATVSYSDVAARIGTPRAVRAVGTASGANPVCLVIPCHRMLRSNGDLGGYGGRLERKAWLLEHERARPMP